MSEESSEISFGPFDDDDSDESSDESSDDDNAQVEHSSTHPWLIQNS